MNPIDIFFILSVPFFLALFYLTLRVLYDRVWLDSAIINPYLPKRGVTTAFFGNKQRYDIAVAKPKVMFQPKGAVCIHVEYNDHV